MSTLDISDTPGSHSGRRRLLAAGAVLVALLAAVTWWARRSPAPSATEPTATPSSPTLALSPEARAAAGLAVEPARSVTRADVFEAPAVLALDETHTARLGSAVEGRVIDVVRDVGDRVRAGALLGTLHSPVIHEAWAAYRTARAEQRRQSSERDFARQAEERATRLFEDKAISAQEVQRAQANRRAAEEALDMASTEVRRAEEELEHLGVTNKDDPTGESGEQIPVASPLTGVVLERLVTPGTAVTPGVPLFVVSDLSTLWVMVEVDETRLSRVAVGRPIALRVSAYPDETFTGAVTFVGDTVNPKTRRVVVRGRVANSDGRLKPEMFATARLDEGTPRPVVVLPSSAVHEIDGRTVVFVEAEGRFTERPVTVGAEAEGTVEITAGLAAGERVATTGSFLLKSTRLGLASEQ